MAITPTVKQRRAAKAVAENVLADKPKNLGVILADIGDFGDFCLYLAS